MTAEEALFLGEPCAHAVRFYERRRLQRIHQQQHRAFWSRRAFPFTQGSNTL